MPVIERTWTFTNGASPILICELGLPPCFKDIRDFEDFVRSKRMR
jgi:hypothetical protein